MKKIELVQKVTTDYYQWVDDLNTLSKEGIQFVFNQALPFEVKIDDLLIFDDIAHFSLAFEDESGKWLKVTAHVARKSDDIIKAENAEIKKNNEKWIEYLKKKNLEDKKKLKDDK